MLGNRIRHLHCSFVVELLLATLAFPLWLLDQTLTKVAAIDLQGPNGQRFDYLLWLMKIIISSRLISVLGCRTGPQLPE
jgi:hypothetical protein